MKEIIQVACVTLDPKLKPPAFCTSSEDTTNKYIIYCQYYTWHAFEQIPGTSGCAKLSLEVETSPFFAVWGIFCSFPKITPFSCLGFWLLGNACQPDLFLRFLGGKLRFLDGKLRRFKCLSAPWWEVQVPQNVPKPKNARRQKKCKFPKKAIISEKTKI